MASASAPASSLAVPPPSASTAEAADLSAGAVILEDQGTAAAAASSTHQFFFFLISDFDLLLLFFTFMCTYSYMGFGHSPTHRFSPFVDLTTFNRSGGVHGAFDDYGEEESTSTLPLFFFPFVVLR